LLQVTVRLLDLVTPNHQTTSYKAKGAATPELCIYKIIIDRLSRGYENEMAETAKSTFSKYRQV
jgi:hypothetical protein